MKRYVALYKKWDTFIALSFPILFESIPSFGNRRLSVYVSFSVIY